MGDDLLIVEELTSLQALYREIDGADMPVDPVGPMSVPEAAIAAALLVENDGGHTSLLDLVDAAEDLFGQGHRWGDLVTAAYLARREAS